MSHFHNQKKAPETVTGGEGSAKRNIIRRHVVGGAHARKEGISGAVVDDGSLYQDSAALDVHDPNYDSEQEFEGDRPVEGGLHRARIAQSRMTLTEYKKEVLPVIKEFFNSGDFDNVADRLQSIDAHEYSYEFVKRLINSSIDLGDQQRELASQLLSTLYPDVLSMNMIGKGFERLFESVDELEIDVPKAREMIAAFIARAVVDEVLPPSFLSDIVIRNLGGEIVDQAILLLSRHHAGAKLERIWGPGDGRPVAEMKVAIDQLLQEFLLSSDFAEAERCIRELQSPLFLHEVVKRAVIIALDKPTEQQLLMSQLLEYIAQIGLVSHHQSEMGFNRLYQALPDLILDVPHAATLLDEFKARAIKSDVLSASYEPPSQQQAP